MDYQKTFLVSHSVFSDRMKTRLRENLTDEEYEAAEIDMGSQGIITYCARVSNPGNQSNFKTGAGLLRYCVRKAHWSVFEQATASIEIETTRDIGRQILRHRSFAFQEFSQRYADPTKSLGMIECREARLQDDSNRQNSIDTDDESIKAEFYAMQSESVNEAQEKYNRSIELGIAKEQARIFLPEGLTMSRMYMIGNLRSWFHYCMLRRAHGTQKEHMDIAEKCWDNLLEIYPFLEEIEVR